MKHFHLQKVDWKFLSIGRWKFFINFDRWIKSSLQVAYFQSIQAISLTKVTSTKSQNHLSGRNYRAGVDWTWDGINIEKFRWGAISIMEIQYLLQLQKRSTQSSSPHAGTPTTDLLECSYQISHTRRYNATLFDFSSLCSPQGRKPTTDLLENVCIEPSLVSAVCPGNDVSNGLLCIFFWDFIKLSGLIN